MVSIRIYRILSIVLAVIGLCGILALTCRENDDALIMSDKSEYLYSKALETIDSVFAANEKDPERYAKFKEAASSLTPTELEEECIRMQSSNDMPWKEEYFARVLVERYSPDMPPEDKTRVVKMLNNLGCIYSEKNKLSDAYLFLKTGYEMDKSFDKTHKIMPAFLCNMAGLFNNYHDDQMANNLYLQSVDLAYSPGYSPDDNRINESAKIQSIIGYLQFAWSTGRLVSNRKDYENYIERLPESTFNHYTYAKYLCDAVNAYVRKEYYKSSELLDSAVNSTTFSYAGTQYHALSKLLQADAMLQAKNLPLMQQHLDEAERVIKENDLIYLYSDLFKSKTSYYRSLGDTVAAARVRAEGMALNDSLFNSRSYASLRNIESQWSKAWTDIKIEQTKRTTILLIISVIILITGIVCFAFTFRHGTKSKTKEPDTPINTVNPAETKKNTDESEACDLPDNNGEESEENLKEFYSDICEALSNSPNLYNVDFSINTFANEMRISSRRISKAVNVVAGKNFSTLVAEYRVKKACDILDQPMAPWERPTMDALAQSVGYKSRANFNRVFKTMTGMSPSEYMSRPKTQS